MYNTYNYKRVETRKLSLFISAIIIALLAFVLLKAETIDTAQIIRSFLILCLCCLWIYSTYRKRKIIVDNNGINIMNVLIPIEKIERIIVSENKIDFFVKKGIFLIGKYLCFTPANFNNTDDWNNFRQDMEILSNKRS